MCHVMGASLDTRDSGWLYPQIDICTTHRTGWMEYVLAALSHSTTQPLLFVPKGLSQASGKRSNFARE